MKLLENKVALITGASRGIGAAAKAFVLARHAPGAVLDRWEAFYRPLLCIERHGEGGV